MKHAKGYDSNEDENVCHISGPKTKLLAPMYATEWIKMKPVVFLLLVVSVK
jgi:hypothetical protein